MAACFIFCAGTMYDLPVKPGEGDLIFAADGGYDVVRELGLAPDLVLGDFDSHAMPEGETVLTFPVKKDDTDSALAVKEGLRRGCDTFHIYGGTGGRRLDHTLANLQLLLWLRRQGARGYLYDRGFVYTAMENETLILDKTVEWGLVSVFCFGDDARGVTIEGLEYSLTDGVLTSREALGVSNHFREPQGRITVRSGALIVGWQLREDA